MAAIISLAGLGPARQTATIAYTIAAKGLPTVAVPTVASQALVTPAPPTTGQPTKEPPAPLAGTLTGNNAGAFARIDLGYPGNGTDMVVTVFYSPADPATRKGVGFTVYGPDGQSWKGETGGTPGEITLTVNSSTVGKYEAVIWN